jgi:hypothetical protein
LETRIQFHSAYELKVCYFVKEYGIFRDKVCYFVLLSVNKPCKVNSFVTDVTRVIAKYHILTILTDLKHTAWETFHSSRSTRFKYSPKIDQTAIRIWSKRWLGVFQYFIRGVACVRVYISKHKINDWVIFHILVIKIAI